MSFLEDYENLVFLKEQEELLKMELQIQLEEYGSDIDVDIEYALGFDVPDYNEFDMFEDTSEIFELNHSDILDEVYLTVNNKIMGSF